MPEEELAALRDLVASAVGFDEARGDVITLKSLSFEPLQTVGSLPSEPGLFAGQIDAMRLLQIAVLAVVALILGVFVIRPLLMPGRRAAALPALVNGSAATAVADDLPVLNGIIEPDTGDAGLPALPEGRQQPGVLNSEDAVARLKTLIEERRSETVEFLRSWLDEPKPEDAR